MTSYLIDTNLLVRMTSGPADPLNSISVQAIDTLTSRGEQGVLVPQVIYEFWSVATRPRSANGLGLTSREADSEISRFADQLFPVLHDDQGIYPHWRRLVTEYDVLGKSAHDTRLVAAMLRHGVRYLLTFNGEDFERFAEIQVVAPDDVAARPNST